MAYDNVHDEILVPSFYAFAILTFKGDANGNVPPVRKIWGPHTMLKNPQAVAVDGPHGPARVRFPVEADEAPPRWLDLWRNRNQRTIH